MIRVYLHIAGMNHYREIVAELAGMIDASGLYDAADILTAVTVGPADLTHLLGSKWIAENGSASLDAYEFPTLSLIQRTAETCPDDVYLYIHTKGASRPRTRDRAVRDAWRRYMAWYLIRDWRTCVDLLDTYDTVGTEIRLPPKHSPIHYAGNFWWARGDYLISLPTPVPKFVWKGDRYAAETWLLGSGIEANAYSFQSFDFPFWSRVIQEDQYRGTQSTNGIRATSEERKPSVLSQSSGS